MDLFRRPKLLAGRKAFVGLTAMLLVLVLAPPSFAAPGWSIDDVDVTEGDSGTVDAVFTVTLSEPAPAGGATVDFETADDTAVAPDDYLPTSGTLTVPAGGSSGNITVQVVGDQIDENDETFFVELLNPSAGTGIIDNSGVGTILDDDPGTISIDNVTVAEPDSVAGLPPRTTMANFPVTLSKAMNTVVTVDFTTVDGTARAGEDYTAKSGTVTFAPGDTSETVAVTVNSDSKKEPNETFFVDLSNAVGADIADDRGQGTITDGVVVNISDASDTEGNSGTKNLTFTVTAVPAPTVPVVINFGTSDHPDPASFAADADPAPATQSSDYDSRNGTIVLSPAAQTGTVTVPIKGDKLNEADEFFFVNISSTEPNTAAIGKGTGVGTIINDDPLPLININDVSVLERDFVNSVAKFTVSLECSNPPGDPSGPCPSGRTVQVDFETADDTTGPNPATAGSDYEPTSGTLTFEPGQTKKTISVQIMPDHLDENAETFLVNLLNEVNAGFGDPQGVGTIIDNDPQPTLSISNATVTEGDTGTTDAIFTVTLSPVSGREVTVDFATADGTATAGSDYQATSGTLTFAAGDTSEEIAVPVIGDLIDEPNETFFVNLSNANRAGIADGQGLGTILDNDAAPTLSIGNSDNNEGGVLGFAVTLSAPSSFPVTVDYASADGSAVAPGDYTAVSNTLTFAPGETFKVISVSTVDDAAVEPQENFFVNLSNPMNATIADGQGEGLINDNDVAPPPTISIGNSDNNEGGVLGFAVTLSAPSASTVTVNFASANGSAVEPGDYTAVSGTITFLPGETFKVIEVSTVDDGLLEPQENFFVNLSSPSNATIADGQGEGLINDND